MANIGKWLLKILVMSVIAAILLGLVGWAYGAVLALSATWGAILGLIFVVVLFGIAVKFNPGKETFLEYLPVLFVVAAVIGTIAILWPAAPFAFVVEWSLVGLGLALSAVFLS